MAFRSDIKKVGIQVPSENLILQGFGLSLLKPYFFGEEDQDDKAPVGTSYLGTPVFMNLAFIPGSYIDKDGNTIEYGEIIKNNEDSTAFKVDTVLVDVTQQKQIIKTNIQGVSGTVKEYISKGDYQIVMRGAIVATSSSVYPELEVLQLKEYLEAEAAIGVASRFLNDIFDITDIVVESFTFPQVEGVQNVQLFEIQAVSDDPIELSVLRK